MDSTLTSLAVMPGITMPRLANCLAVAFTPSVMGMLAPFSTTLTVS